jgi:hypothetical protein
MPRFHLKPAPPHAKPTVWKENPRHGSLRFQKRGRYWRVCFGSGHRALAVAVPDGYLWFWIGTHDEYERLLKLS